MEWRGHIIWPACSFHLIETLNHLPTVNCLRHCSAHSEGCNLLSAHDKCCAYKNVKLSYDLSQFSEWSAERNEKLLQTSTEYYVMGCIMMLTLESLAAVYVPKGRP